MKQTKNNGCRSKKAMAIIVIAMTLAIAAGLCACSPWYDGSMDDNWSDDGVYVNIRIDENGECKITQYETMPETVSVGDMYMCGDYVYTCGIISIDGVEIDESGWNVSLAAQDHFLDNQLGYLKFSVVD